MNETRLKSWSYSRLQIFESCRYRARLAFLDRIPEGEEHESMVRGTQIHKQAEEFVQAKVVLSDDLKAFKAELTGLQELYKEGRVEVEQEWGFDEKWETVPWKSATLRVKCDAVVHRSETQITNIDYKSGKRVGKEIRHGEQMMLYALATFLRYPQVQEVIIELWYSDIDHIETKTYTRHQGLSMLRSFERRAKALLTAIDFPPNPNIWTCRYCPYSPRKNGFCKAGV